MSGGLSSGLKSTRRKAESWLNESPGSGTRAGELSRASAPCPCPWCCPHVSSTREFSRWAWASGPPFGFLFCLALGNDM